MEFRIPPPSANLTDYCKILLQHSDRSHNTFPLFRDPNSFERLGIGAVTIAQKAAPRSYRHMGKNVCFEVMARWPETTAVGRNSQPFSFRPQRARSCAGFPIYPQAIPLPPMAASAPASASTAPSPWRAGQRRSPSGSASRTVSHLIRHSVGLRSTMTSPTGWHCFGPEACDRSRGHRCAERQLPGRASAAGDKYVAIDQYPPGRGCPNSCQSQPSRPWHARRDESRPPGTQRRRDRFALWLGAVALLAPQRAILGQHIGRIAIGQVLEGGDRTGYFAPRSLRIAALTPQLAADAQDINQAGMRRSPGKRRLADRPRSAGQHCRSRARVCRRYRGRRRWPPSAGR